MKHRHYDMIVAWANDPSVVVQTNVTYDYYGENVQEEWVDVRQPIWDVQSEYRIKPVAVWHRETLFSAGKNGVVISYDKDDPNPEQNKNFIRWINDWQEVEI
jgi:hypothetical protein